MVSWFIARRYLSSRFVTFAAFILVSLSVAILIILLAVMEGFRTEMIERIRGTSSDIKVKSTQFVGMDDHEEVAEVVTSVPGVRAAVPYVETLAIFKLLLPPGVLERTGHLGLLVLDMRAEARAGELDEYLLNAHGKMVTRGAPQSIDEVLSRDWVERGLWEDFLRMRPPSDAAGLRPVLLGSEVFPDWFGNLMGFRMELTSISPVSNQPRTQQFVVAGYFQSRDVHLDTNTLLVDLPDGAEFLALESPSTGAPSISGLRVFLDEGGDVAAIRDEIERRITAADIPFVMAQTWEQEKEKILRAVRMEKTMVGIILGVIIIFVGLMVFIIMTVQIVEKTRDLGILQAVGFTPNRVQGIFLRMGGVICLAGIALGVLYGVLFCLNMETIQRWVFVLTGREVFPRHVYYIDSIPVKLVPSDFAFIIVPTVLFSFFASLFAARRAARMDPLEALRTE